MKNIIVKKADITTATTDVIVNAANPKMLGGGGVDGAIHRAAGPKLLEACRQVPSVNGIRCRFGESRLTVAGELACRYVIHTVGPIYRHEDKPDEVLASAYNSACKLALENGCRSIAFPALSCGAYGYPHKEAAQIALQTCGQAKFSQLSIVFYIYTDSLYELFRMTLEQLSAEEPGK